MRRRPDGKQLWIGRGVAGACSLLLCSLAMAAPEAPLTPDTAPAVIPPPISVPAPPLVPIPVTGAAVTPAEVPAVPSSPPAVAAPVDPLSASPTPPAAAAVPPPPEPVPAPPAPATTVAPAAPPAPPPLPVASPVPPRPAVSGSSPFVDTRATFICMDDDFLHDAGETLPNSPSFGCGTRYSPSYLRASTFGLSSSTHLVSYAQLPSYFDRVTAEAALVFRVTMDSVLTGNYNGEKGALVDDGSFFNIRYDLNRETGERLELTLLPFNTDRFYLGHDLELAWGTSAMFGANRKSPVSGLKLSYRNGEHYAFAGAKTTQILRFASYDDKEANDEVDTFYAGLLGGGYALSPELLLELGTGYFQRGTNPNNPVRGESVETFGVSGQLTYHSGVPVRLATDITLYRIDPTLLPRAKEPGEERPFGLSIAGQGVWLRTNMEDPDHYGGTRFQDAFAADLKVLFQQSGWLFRATAAYETLAFYLANVPGYIPYQDFQDGLDTSPLVWGELHGEYSFPAQRLTASVELRVIKPTTVKSTVRLGNNPPTEATGERTIVFHGTEYIVLPPKETAVPVFSSAVQLRWDISRSIATFAELKLEVDGNRVEYVDDPVGISERVFSSPYLLGGFLMAQARF